MLVFTYRLIITGACNYEIVNMELVTFVKRAAGVEIGFHNGKFRNNSSYTLQTKSSKNVPHNNILLYY